MRGFSSSFCGSDCCQLLYWSRPAVSSSLTSANGDFLMADTSELLKGEVNGLLLEQKMRNGLPSREVVFFRKAGTEYGLSSFAIYKKNKKYWNIPYFSFFFSSQKLSCEPWMLLPCGNNCRMGCLPNTKMIKNLENNGSHRLKNNKNRHQSPWDPTWIKREKKMDEQIWSIYNEHSKRFHIKFN